MNHRQAIDTDLPIIKELLNSNKLPSDDCGEKIENFIVIEDNDNIVGLGGLESFGTLGLVRSIVVKSDYRGNGIGKCLYRLIEKRACESGIQTLYLLTQTATDYFEKLGFVIQERSKVPVSIRETRQFKDLCPSTATVMSRAISDRHAQ